MGDPKPVVDEPFELDLSHIQTEDGEPVDNVFSEKQMRLLTESLYASWRDGEGNVPVFAAFANVGLFYALHEQPIVPDVMVSLGVRAAPDPSDKKTLSYFMWEHGKPPDIVIEIVSNREGGEDSLKLKRYAQVGVAYYAIYDPDGKLSRRPLRVFERHGNGYVEFLDPAWLPRLGLGLVIWEGLYEHCEGLWLRWIDEKRQLLATGAEALSATSETLAATSDKLAAASQTLATTSETLAATSEALAASREATRLAEERALRLAEQLRQLGIKESDPG